jgi:hypothetical protein
MTYVVQHPCRRRSSKRDGNHLPLAGRGRPEKVKRKFFAALLNSKPITPRHQPPKAISEKISSLVADEDRRFFRDFEDFAEVVNWWLADEHVGSSWRIARHRTQVSVFR